MKNYKNQSQILESKIIGLENKKRESFQALRTQFDITYEELRPSKIVLRALDDIKKEPKIKNNLIESFLGLAGGFVSKKILIGKSNSVFKNLFGYAVQYLTTKIILKNLKH